MDKFINVTVFRRVVQLFFFVLLVYGSLFFSTFYIEDKFTNALPALSCAYDMKGSDYCALIPVQHQLDHSVAAFFQGKRNFFAGVMPFIITIGTFALLVVILNKAFCGWTCPLGFFQEVIGLIGDKLKIKKIQSLSQETLQKVRPIKWFILIFLVFIFPLLTGLGFLGHEFGSAFCSICPSRIMTTLMTGDSHQVYVDNSSFWYMFFSILADLLFGLMIALALFVKQPFCRICPMLPFQAVFKKVGLLRLVKNSSSKCDTCGNCTKQCPMDIYEIQKSVKKPTNITFTDCTLCGRCVEFCPDENVLSLQYTKFPLFRSSKEQFKKRVKQQKFWEKK